MKGTTFDVWVADIPLTGEQVIPIDRLKNVQVKSKKVRFRTPNDSNRQVKNLIAFEDGDEKGEIFYTRRDLKDYLQLTIDHHRARLQAEKAQLDEFIARVKQELE